MCNKSVQALIFLLIIQIIKIKYLIFKKIFIKNFAIVLKISKKYDKLNELLKKGYSAFIVATSFIKDLQARKVFKLVKLVQIERMSQKEGSEFLEREINRISRKKLFES